MVQIPGSILTSRTETSSLHEWSGIVETMLCRVKKVSYGEVFDLAIEQPQLVRKLH